MQRIGLQPAPYLEAAAYRMISRYRDMKRHDNRLACWATIWSLVPLGTGVGFGPGHIVLHEVVPGVSR